MIDLIVDKSGYGTISKVDLARSNRSGSTTSTMHGSRKFGFTFLGKKEMKTNVGAPWTEGSIIVFADWAYQTTPEDEYEEPLWAWLEGTTNHVEEAQKAAIGSQVCYEICFVRSLFTHGEDSYSRDFNDNPSITYYLPYPPSNFNSF